MIIALNDAPPGQPLLVVAVRNQGLASELGKLGIRHGTELIRLEPDVSVVQPMRIRGPKGEVILTGNMASGLVVHLDDGEIAPLLDMQPGNKGHLEGITVNPDSALAETFAVLGLKENDTVELLRRLPPMEYAALVEHKRRICLPGGMAAKLWGLCQGRRMQFAAAAAAKPFTVERILGGQGAQGRIKIMGIAPGTNLVLEQVRPAQTVRVATKDPVAVSTLEGLRFWLPPQAAGLLMVKPTNR